MTRQSKRELERALEDLQERAGDYDGPEDIVITHERVGTDWQYDDPPDDRPDLDPGETEVWQVQHIWRDDAGEWQSERLEGDEAREFLDDASDRA